MTAQQPEVLTDDYAYAQLPARANATHKGDFGHVLIIGGDHGFGGSVRLSGIAALRTGAGKVTVACHPVEAPRVSSSFPELMSVALDKNTSFMKMLARASVIIVGPGMTDSEWSRTVWQTMQKQRDLPMVIDAGALRLLAKAPQDFASRNYVMTPHPGEAAALLATNTEEVQRDREKAVTALAANYQGVAVLKGAGTLVREHEDNKTYICTRGNPGMSTAGTGDILAGVIAGLLGQGLTTLDAAKVGVFIHAAAGDMAAKHGERGMIASDLLPYIRQQVNRFGGSVV